MGFNLGVLMRALFGIGSSRTLQGGGPPREGMTAPNMDFSTGCNVTDGTHQLRVDSNPRVGTVADV